MIFEGDAMLLTMELLLLSALVSWTCKMDGIKSRDRYRYLVMILFNLASFLASSLSVIGTGGSLSGVDRPSSNNNI